MDLKYYIKHGKNRHGIQRYKHKVSGKTCIQPCNYRSLSQETKSLAIKAVVYEGISFRKVARLFNVHHTSVMRWVYNKSEEVDYQTLNEDSMVSEVEVDEIYVICSKKKREQNMNISTLQ